MLVTTEAIQQYSSYPLHSIWLKTGKKFFETPLGIVAYESTKKANVVAGDPLCFDKSENKQHELFNDFVNWSHAQGKMVCGYYFSENFSEHINHFNKYKVGVSRILDINNYKESGFKSRDFRRAFNQGCKNNLNFFEIEHVEKDKWVQKLKPLEKQWLQSKRGPQLSFLLDEISTQFPGAEKERWFAVLKNNNIHAFLSILPYTAENGQAYYVDHLIQFDQNEKWALDYLIAHLVRQLKSEDVHELSFGFAAFQKVNINSYFEFALKFQQKFQPFYKTNGLYAYKKKFTSREESRYLLFDSCCFNLRQIMALLNVTIKRNRYFQ